MEPSPSPKERFRNLDPYRAEREWRRYEGTAQRELFLTLRRRFLQRHRATEGWVADLGSGPGRFADDLAPPHGSTVLLDVARETLRLGRARPRPLRRTAGAWHWVQGDAERAPLRPGRFAAVGLLGNVLGFAEGRWEELLRGASELVAPTGTLLLELAPGPGERSVYLTRLPPGATARTLRGPKAWLTAKLQDEGFRRESARARGEVPRFERISPRRLEAALLALGFRSVEAEAIAPCLGADPTRLEAVHADRLAWDRLLEVEATAGRDPARGPASAAMLVAARRPPGGPGGALRPPPPSTRG